MQSWLAHILNSKHARSSDCTSALAISRGTQLTVYAKNEIDPFLASILDNQPHSQQSNTPKERNYQSVRPSEHLIQCTLIVICVIFVGVGDGLFGF